MIDINYLDKALAVTTSAFKNYLLKKAAEKRTVQLQVHVSGRVYEQLFF